MANDLFRHNGNLEFYQHARQRGVRGTMRGVRGMRGMRGVRGIAISLIFTLDHIVGSTVELIEVMFFKVHR